jgi:hypothetical protein
MSEPVALHSVADEARHLHACLFRQPLDAAVIARYEEAHRRWFANASPALLVVVVARGLDAEAVEFALRRRKLGRDLTRRMQVLCYLVEVRSAYYSEFVNSETSRASAWSSLLAVTVDCVWKFLKGEYLVRRYGLL